MNNQKKLNEALMEAVHFGNLTQVKETLKSGAQINDNNSVKGTALMEAIRHGRTEICQYLIEEQADVNAVFALTNETPLFLAINNQHFGAEKICTMLMDAGANVDAKDRFGNTPLSHAINHGRNNLSLELIKRGADLHAYNDNGYLLRQAASKGFGGVCMKLIEAGDNIHTADDQGNTALMFSTFKGLGDVSMELIKRGADPKVVNKGGATPLIGAAYKGLGKVCDKLIELGADIHAKDHNGRSVLLGAAYGGLGDLFCKLVAEGENNISAKQSPGGETTLMYAAHSGLADICQMLIDAGLKVNQQDAGKDTALMYAAQSGKIEAVEVLLNAGAEVNVRNGVGKTPLLYAVINGNRTICRKLLEAHADVHVKDDNGKTPFMEALAYRRNNICWDLIAAGVDIDEPSPQGYPMIHMAESSHHYEGVKILLRAGADTSDFEIQEEWREGMYEEAVKAFPVGKIPKKEQCITDNRCSDAVLDACFTQQFDTLVAGPLLHSQDPQDKALFKQMWDMLPERWREQNQGMYIEYAKQVQHRAPAKISISERGLS